MVIKIPISASTFKLMQVSDHAIIILAIVLVRITLSRDDTIKARRTCYNLTD